MIHTKTSRTLLEDLNEEYINLRDSLDDAFSAIEDLQSDLEATLDALSDSLESIRDGLNGADRAFRKFQYHRRGRRLEKIFQAYPLEPGEQFVLPPDEIIFSDKDPFSDDGSQF